MKAQVMTWIVLSVFLISGQAGAEDAKPETTTSFPSAAGEPKLNTSSSDVNYIMCRNGKEVRTIRVEKKGRGCRALYTKNGVDQVVGKSATSEICQKVAGRIKVNLENGDWKCKDVNQARVSSSME